MGRILFVSAGLVLALAACGKSGQAGGNGQAAAAGNEAAPAASGVKDASLHVDPGEWEVTEETLNASGTGPSAAYLERLKGHKTTSRQCITPEEANKPFTFSRNHDHQCDYSHIALGGGSIKGTISCNDPRSNGSMTMTMDGHYSARSYEMATSMQMNMRGTSTRIDSRQTAHRVGDCAAGGKDPE